MARIWTYSRRKVRLNSVMALFRSIATVGGWTMVSRVLGFARDMLIANVIGAGLIADAFFVAF